MAKSSGSGCGGWLVVGLVVLVGLVYFGNRVSTLREEARKAALGYAPKPSVSKASVPVVFDVPSLVGKTIDEVRTVLGQPADTEPEPAKLQRDAGFDEWQNIFNKDGRELLVTFDPRSRRVKDFFLAGDDYVVMMQWGNLRMGAGKHRLEEVKAIKNPSTITGLKVIPR